MAGAIQVLILIVVGRGLVHETALNKSANIVVLILIVVGRGLVPILANS